MRITDQNYLNTLQDSLAIANRQIQKLTEQVSSGKALTRPSDDPAAAGRILRGQAQLQEVQTRHAVYQVAQRQLGIADNALGEMSNALTNACDLALQGQNDISQTDECKTLANQLRDISDQIYTLGNTADGFVYLFSGSKSTTAPLVKDPPSGDPVGYQGGFNAQQFEIAPGTSSQVGVTGAELFNFADPTTGQRAVTSAPTDVFSALNNLADQLESGDSAGVATSLTQLQALQAHVVEERGAVGLQATRYNAADDAASQTELRLQSTISQDQDVDIVKAVMDLQNQQTAYEGALTAIGRVLQLPTLWSMIGAGV